MYFPNDSVFALHLSSKIAGSARITSEVAGQCSGKNAWVNHSKDHNSTTVQNEAGSEKKTTRNSSPRFSHMVVGMCFFLAILKVSEDPGVRNEGILI